MNFLQHYQERSIETFSNKWGDRDFGGSLTESLKEDTARMFSLNQMSKLEFVYKMNANNKWVIKNIILNRKKFKLPKFRK
jgi:hypothetical protein